MITFGTVQLFRHHALSYASICRVYGVCINSKCIEQNALFEMGHPLKPDIFIPECTTFDTCSHINSCILYIVG